VGSLAALHQRREGEEPWPDRGPTTWMTHSRSVLFKGHDNDPSAGSPTETFRPARGSGRPFSEVGPLLNLAHGSKRVDPKRKRVKRITNLSICGAPRVGPPRP